MFIINKILKIISITISVIILLICFYFVFCRVAAFFIFTPENLCEITVIKEIVTPDDKFKVIEYVLDCGATTPEYINVSIIKKDERLRKRTGNIFRASNSHSIDVELKDKNIIIRIKDKSQTIFFTEENFLNYSIQYIR